MCAVEVDYSEEQVTSASVAGSGGTEDNDITIAVLPPGRSLVRIHEVVLDSLSTDFDVAIFEATARTTLNRIFNVQNVDLHTVQLLGTGNGAQYRDRDVATETTQAQFFVRFTNNQVGAATVTIRIRYSVFFAR